MPEQAMFLKASTPQTIAVKILTYRPTHWKTLNQSSVTKKLVTQFIFYDHLFSTNTCNELTEINVLKKIKIKKYLPLSLKE